MNRDPAVLLQTVQRFRFVAFFVLVIGAGAYLRFHDLGRSQLWLDELVQLMRAHHASVWACLLDIGNDIGSAPLDYLIQRAFVSMWGVTPWTARFHAAVFGTLSIPMIYVTARRLFSVRTSFISMVLFSVYPLHRYYSQEGRNYALFVLLTLVSWYLLLRLSEKTEAKVWVAAVVTNVLLLYTNDLGVVVLAGQFLFQHRQYRFEDLPGPGQDGRYPLLRRQDGIVIEDHREHGFETAGTEVHPTFVLHAFG